MILEIFNKELDNYQNPHKTLQEVYNKVAAKKRLQMIDDITKARSSNQAMAKIQINFENHFNKVLDNLPVKMAKYL